MFNRIGHEELEKRVGKLEATLKKSEASKKTGLTPALKNRLEAGERMLQAIEVKWSKIEDRLENLEAAADQES